MPKTELSIPHRLGTAEAKRRIIHLLSETQAKLGGKLTDVQEEWTEHTGRFQGNVMGFALTGMLQVEPTVVNLTVTLPFAALPFKSRLEKDLMARAQALLAETA